MIECAFCLVSHVLHESKQNIEKMPLEGKLQANCMKYPARISELKVCSSSYQGRSTWFKEVTDHFVLSF